MESGAAAVASALLPAMLAPETLRGSPDVAERVRAIAPTLTRQITGVGATLGVAHATLLAGRRRVGRDWISCTVAPLSTERSSVAAESAPTGRSYNRLMRPP